MWNFKPKEKFDKFSIRGLIYTGIASLGIGYELLYANEIRPLLIFGYSVVIFIGLLCLLFISELD